jgi:hypothetical protein
VCINDVSSIVTPGLRIINGHCLQRRQVVQAAVVQLNLDARHKDNRGDAHCDDPLKRSTPLFIVARMF